MLDGLFLFFPLTKQVWRGVVVWYVAEDGEKTEVPTTCDEKTVSFTV